MTAKLQVALDQPQGDRALQIAREAVDGGADWIEAGTPLIKSEGLAIVRRLRQEFPDATIVADLKTMDVGALEADLAARSGADIVLVMGVASDSTIAEAAQAAAKYGAKVMVDMMAVSDPMRRAREVAALGASYICLHLPVDEQMRGNAALDMVPLMAGSPLPVAVAGGITAESAVQLASAGADVIIVGGAITKSADVASATGRIKLAIASGKCEETGGVRRYCEDELMKAFSEVSTPNISDAQHRQGVMRGIGPVNIPPVKMVGRAVTVQTANGDWAKPVEAIDQAQPGDVIVIDAGGGGIAVWGELASLSARKKGLAGIVIDGAVRDAEEIRDMAFPCFARHIAPDAGEPKGFGGIGVQIICGGVRVRPRDWIVGDANGVVVVPAERAVETANRSRDVLERENRVREEIARGSTLARVLELKRWEMA